MTKATALTIFFYTGYTGYAPSNYLQAEENPEEIAAAKRARREKMIAERNELRANVKQKRDLRKQLEDEVNTLEEVRHNAVPRTGGRPGRPSFSCPC